MRPARRSHGLEPRPLRHGGALRRIPGIDLERSLLGAAKLGADPLRAWLIAQASDELELMASSHGPSGLSMWDALPRLDDTDGGRALAQNDHFETLNDPQFVERETVQRPFRGQLRRRLRHPQCRVGPTPSSSSNTLRSCRT